MTIDKKRKHCITLNVYLNDIEGINQAIDKFLKIRTKVYILVQGYTNLFKKVREEVVTEEDAFIFLDVTTGESCITNVYQNLRK